MEPSIRAAFFDIDGTLLPFGAEAVPRSTRNALKTLQRNGIRTFIASGRPPIHLPLLHALDDIPFDGYVTMNGQYCYLRDGTLLYDHAIDPASLRTLLPYIQRERISVGFIEKDRSPSILSMTSAPSSAGKCGRAPGTWRPASKQPPSISSALSARR